MAAGLVWEVPLPALQGVWPKGRMEKKVLFIIFFFCLKDLFEQIVFCLLLVLFWLSITIFGFHSVAGVDFLGVLMFHLYKTKMLLPKLQG